jgi:hypothetical protein
VNSLTTLLIRVLEESGTRCGVDTHQDTKHILDRVEHEGQSFLTITLPTFGKDLQKALSLGCVEPGMFPAFSKVRGTLFPEMFSGFMAQVFDFKTNRMLNVGFSTEVQMASALREMFQVTGMFAKIETPPTPERVEKAFGRYIENESHVREMDRVRTKEMYQKFSTTASVLFGDLFNYVQKDIENERIRPMHGPGSTADRLLGNAKWDNRSWPEQLEEVFPFGRYAFSSWRHYLDLVDSGSDVPGTAMPVKVIAVPKTQKTPRIIAMEPTSMQYMQQGLRRSIENGIEQFPYVRDLISYKSQEPNQLLARAGSFLCRTYADMMSSGLTYGWGSATLDLSDASDLVSNQLVRSMVKNYPLLGMALDATRSRTADVRGHGVQRLAKYASMGSALCFPIEAMVFSTVIFIALQEAHPERSLKSLIQEFVGRVRVYGDDIIVPVEHAQRVSDSLEAYGLKVNRAKSFWTGMFRESCGKEYWNGYDVTYVKVRYHLPSKRMPRNEWVESVVRTVALRNNFFLKEYHAVCEFLDEVLLKELGSFPYVGPDSPALGRLSYDKLTVDRMDVDLHKPMVKAWAVEARIPVSNLDGAGALMKFFSGPPDLPNPDEKHLYRAGRPSSLRIKKRWLSVL